VTGEEPVIAVAQARPRVRERVAVLLKASVAVAAPRAPKARAAARAGAAAPVALAEPVVVAQGAVAEAVAGEDDETFLVSSLRFLVGGTEAVRGL